jgi:hypothetical protein
MSSTENNQVAFSSSQMAHLAIVEEADGDLAYAGAGTRTDRAMRCARRKSSEGRRDKEMGCGSKPVRYRRAEQVVRACLPSCMPMLLVTMMSVFLKLTVRPLLSVRR